jgi:glucokinase
MTAAGLALGVDIGGTKVAAGLVNAEGAILEKVRVPMVAHGTANEGLASVTSAMDALLSTGIQRAALRGIGVCSPGPLDPRRGVVINPPNVPCWRNFPLVAEIAARYGLPVHIENDASAAALAEVRWGAGRGFRYVFYATIGTGIGTGLVLDGKIYNGRTGAAAEGGHVTIDYRGPVCGCGKRGCIEALASGPAIAARARAALEEASAPGTGSPRAGEMLLALAGGNPAAVTTEMVAKACAAVDSIARQVLEETVALLTVWLGSVVDLIEPDVILIGGGVAQALEPFFMHIRQSLPRNCIVPHPEEIPLRMAHYGDEAGIAGAAALCG